VFVNRGGEIGRFGVSFRSGFGFASVFGQNGVCKSDTIQENGTNGFRAWMEDGR
jgi:hypothetical protein